MDVLIDKLASKCESSNGTKNDLGSLQPAMTIVSEIQSKDLDNIPILVENSCQTVGEMQSVNKIAHVCVKML